MWRKFTLWHSLAGLVTLLLIEGLLLQRMPGAHWLILVAAAAGAVGAIYVATEIIEEVRGTPRVLTMLSAVVTEYILFFSFQYAYLLAVDPASFPTLSIEPVSLALHSAMVFVFNPLYIPATGDGRALLLIETLGALALGLFILQNIGQFVRAQKN